MKIDTVSEYGWKVETIINDKKISATVRGTKYNVRSLIQIITAPDGSQIQIEQLLDNVGDFNEIGLKKT